MVHVCLFKNNVRLNANCVLSYLTKMSKKLDLFFFFREMIYKYVLLEYLLYTRIFDKIKNVDIITASFYYILYIMYTYLTEHFVPLYECVTIDTEIGLLLFELAWKVVFTPMRYVWFTYFFARYVRLNVKHILLRG